jgi:hypothetical protein
MPYVLKKRHGLTLLTTPPLTKYLGPWLRESDAKYTNRLSRQKELMQELIDRLPPFDYFIQPFHYSVTNWLPFYWRGFEQTTNYTYVIEDLHDLESVWGATRENIRREVRKACKKVAVHTGLSVTRFLDLNEMTFKRQGRPLPYTCELVERLDSACAMRDARKIFFAEDSHGRIHAAVYIVWDEESAYYLMGGADPELRNSGVMSLLIWEAIQFSAKVTKRFDFEGSMVESIERFFRAFGARQVPYFSVKKVSSRRLRAYLALQALLRP